MNRRTLIQTLIVSPLAALAEPGPKSDTRVFREVDWEGEVHWRNPRQYFPQTHAEDWKRWEKMWKEGVFLT